MSPGSRNEKPLCAQGIREGRKRILRLRARMVQAVREFFLEREYLEVETPILMRAPAPEAHIDAFQVGDLFLQTSPELCMKRLLSAGCERIFQISKVFRSGERGEKHLPEFTLLEWYRTGIDYFELMDECEALILSVAQRLTGETTLSYDGKSIQLAVPWEKISVRDAFRRFSSSSVEDALEAGSFDHIMVEQVEPRLGSSHPVFLYDYPAQFAALAKLKRKDNKLAERFELYIAGLELANGFSELTDAFEQRRRFNEERSQRLRLGKCTYPMPEGFLEELSHMPEAAGIALGVDRLAMLFADQQRIDNVVAFTPEAV